MKTQIFELFPAQLIDLLPQYPKTRRLATYYKGLDLGYFARAFRFDIVELFGEILFQDTTDILGGFVNSDSLAVWRYQVLPISLLAMQWLPVDYN